MDLVTSEMATTPLYESALLQALQQHFTWFTQHPSVSKEAFSEMLYTLHHGTLPHGNLLPDSYDKAMAVIKEYVMSSSPLCIIAVQMTVSRFVVTPQI